jgi:hypothetical protein
MPKVCCRKTGMTTAETIESKQKNGSKPDEQ